MCFWGQVIHVVKKQCVSNQHEVTMSEYFCYREKKARDKRCKVNVKSMERKQQTWIKQQLQILPVVLPTYSLTENLPLGVWLVQQTSHPPLWLNQTKNYLLWLFDTGLHNKYRDYKLLAAATSHVNQTNILITHTHQAKTHHHYEFICKILKQRFLPLYNLYSLSIKFLLQKRGGYTDTRMLSISLEREKENKTVALFIIIIIIFKSYCSCISLNDNTV